MLLKKGAGRPVVEITRHDEQRDIRAAGVRHILQVADELLEDIERLGDADIAGALGSVQPEAGPLSARKQDGGDFALYDRLPPDGGIFRTACLDLLQREPFNGLDLAAPAVLSDMRKGDGLPIYAFDLPGKLLSARRVQFVPPPEHMHLSMRFQQGLQFVVLHSFLRLDKIKNFPPFRAVVAAKTASQPPFSIIKKTGRKVNPCPLFSFTFSAGTRPPCSPSRRR